MAKAKKADLSSPLERERIFLEIIEHLSRYNDAEKRWIAETAGIHWGTLYSWCSLKTWAPQIRTLAPVARALGYDIVLKRQRPAPPKLKIVPKKQKRKKS